MLTKVPFYFLGAASEVETLKKAWPRPRRKRPMRKLLVKSMRPGSVRSSRSSRTP